MGTLVAKFVGGANVNHPWPEGQELLRMMLLKDIRAGIGVSTVNKVWENLCISISYSRCQTK